MVERFREAFNLFAAPTCGDLTGSGPLPAAYSAGVRSSADHVS